MYMYELSITLRPYTWVPHFWAGPYSSTKGSTSWCRWPFRPHLYPVSGGENKKRKWCNLCILLEKIVHIDDCSTVTLVPWIKLSSFPSIRGSHWLKSFSRAAIQTNIGKTNWFNMINYDLDSFCNFLLANRYCVYQHKASNCQRRSHKCNIDFILKNLTTAPDLQLFWIGGIHLYLLVMYNKCDSG